MVRRLDRGRFAPQVACLAGEGCYTDLYRALGLPVHHLRICAGRPWRLLRLVSLLRRERIRVIQTFLFHANIAGRLAAALAGTPVVVGGVRTAEPRHWHTLLDGLTFGLTSGEVCVSEYVRDYQAHRAGLRPGALAVIPNGVDPADYATPAAPFGLGDEAALRAREDARRRLGLPHGTPVIAFVGRFCEAKALPDLLAAFRLVASRRPEVVLAMAGDGPLAGEVRAMVQRAGLERRVVLTGWLQDPRVLYAAADLFVISSVVEGMPGVVLEAMASGLPVVSTDAPGCRELVEHPATGLIVPRRAPGALADALLLMLGEPEKAAQCGGAGRRRAFSHFHIQRTARLYEALYEQALERAEAACLRRR